MRKIPFAGIELTSQRVRGLRGTSELSGRVTINLILEWPGCITDSGSSVELTWLGQNSKIILLQNYKLSWARPVVIHRRIERIYLIVVDLPTNNTK